MLKIENLTFTYPLCEKPTLENISFTVEKGDFVAVCGATGSGKSTLMRMLKRELSPLGEKKGSIFFNGTLLEKLSVKTSPQEIGYVMQKPEQQIVTDKVWHELAFGLENMNVPPSIIASRVAEMTAYFGIESWYEKSVTELSGGQKQILNLASIMVMQPQILILDEPTAQLDPISATDFIATLKKLNRELNLTIIIVEHRLEDVIPVSNKLLVLEKGKILSYDTVQNVIKNFHHNPELLRTMPAAVRLYHSLKGEGDCPIDVSRGRKFIEDNFKNNVKFLHKNEYQHSVNPALRFKNVYFRYEKNSADVLKDLNLTVYENEIFCLLGSNGSGKTTMLSVISNLVKFYSGSIEILGKNIKKYKNQTLYQNCLALLPQDVQTVFLCNTVEEELQEAKAEINLLPFDINYLMDKHPYDLSGGEQQLVALAKVLATNPKILLLDEPTKGIDENSKLELVKIFGKLKKRGITIIIVTHDVEFASLCGDRCGLFFQGRIVSEGTSQQFFANNNFYTTAINRMTKGYFDNVVTVEDAVELCKLNGRKGGTDDSNKK